MTHLILALTDTVGFTSRSDSDNAIRGQLVRPKRNVRDMGFLYVAIIVIFCLLCVAFTYLYSRVTVVHVGYEMNVLSAARDASTERNKRLRLELAKLKAPERIESKAFELGLLYPDGTQVVHLR